MTRWGLCPSDWDRSVCNPSDAACQCHTPEGIAGVCASIGLENAAGALAAVMSEVVFRSLFHFGFSIGISVR